MVPFYGLVPGKMYDKSLSTASFIFPFDDSFISRAAATASSIIFAASFSIFPILSSLA